MSGHFKLARAGRSRARGRFVFLESLEPRRLLSNTYTVLNANDAGPGSLRQALTDANNHPGPDTIAFALPGPGAHVITAGSMAYPLITDTLTIDGFSQGGAGYAGPPLIRIDGGTAHTADTAFYFYGTDNDVVQGLAITKWGTALTFNNAFSGVGNNTIFGNYLGLNTAGNSGLGNVSSGLSLYHSSNNTISNNVISANGLTTGAAAVYQDHGSGNVYIANFIGTDITGKTAIPNGGAGIYLADGSTNNRIGPNPAGANPAAQRNVISGNIGSGVTLTDAGTSANLVFGNLIGTDITGAKALGNTYQGIVLFTGASNNQITGNVISANGATNHFPGIELYGQGVSGNTIQGNFIGTDINGAAKLGNGGVGVLIHNGAANNLVGSNFDGIGDNAERNIISANGFSGVEIDDAATTGNRIAGNYIGTDVSGTLPLSNADQGVFIGYNANGNTIDRNVIAANSTSGLKFAGLEIYGSATANIVIGNSIGVNASGQLLPNGGDGVWMHYGAANNRIGTNGDGVNDAAEANVIAGSAPGYAGIEIGDVNSNNNLIAGNRIGTDITGTLPRPNGGPGIFIRDGASGNQIGGPSAVFGNIIAFNASNYAEMGGYHYDDSPGVVITGANSLNNSIRANLIHDNHGVGIDLSTNGFFDGVNVNSQNNLDAAGPNGLQNYPVLLAASAGDGAPGHGTAIYGTLNSRPNTIFTLDFYATSAPNPSLMGDAQRYLGNATVTTDSLGNATFNLGLPVATTTSDYISATATDAAGNTSEFSADLKVGTVQPTLSATTWTPLGPAPVSTLGDGTIASGRVADVVPDPTNQNVMYLVADGGGIWKTTDWPDANPIWTPLTDTQSSLDMSDGYATLAIAASNPQILYAAPSGPGGGILKSTNGGASWTLQANALFDEAHFGSIVVDPTNASIVYVSVRDSGTAPGVYKSIDGGVTWNNTTSSIFTTGSAYDLVMAPGSPQTLYATVVGAGAASGIYKTTNGGGLWTHLDAGLLIGTAIGWGARVAVAPSNPNILYATLFDPSIGDPPTGDPHRYISTNAGATWTTLPALPSFDENRYWHVVLTVDPTNPAIVYVNGDHELYRSTDSGQTWQGIFGEDPVNVRFDNTGALVLTGDRGVHRWPGGLTPFENKQGNLQNAESYTLALDPSNERTIYAVTQDHGSVLKYTGNTTWNYTGGGDEVGKVIVSPTNSARLFDFTPGGPDAGPAQSIFERSDDGGATFVDKVNGLPSGVANFALASAGQQNLTMDPTNPHRLLVGVTQVYETTDDADDWHSITGNADLSAGQYITSIATAASAPNTVYAATADGKLFVTTNDGATAWQERDTGLPLDPFNHVMGMAIDSANSLHVFAVTGEDRGGSIGNHVFQTIDGGAHWTSINGNLNPELFAQAIAVDWRFATPTLYVATALGVYVSANTGATWSPLASGLPNVLVTDVQLNGNLLAASTYGRGIWEVRVGSPTDIAFSGNAVISKDLDGIDADITVNAGPTQKVLISQMSAITFTGGSGNDKLTLDFSAGNPLPAGGVTFNGGAGVNTLSVIGTRGDDILTAGPGGILFSAGGAFSNIPITAASVQSIQFIGGSGGTDALNVVSGAYTIDGSTPAVPAPLVPNVTVNVSPAAIATFTSDQRLAALNINGGIANTATTSRKTIGAAAVSIAGQGKLDLGGNDLITTTSAATIRSYLLSGYGINQDWSGSTGITSSVAAANPVVYTIGYADGGDQSAQDAGIPISPGQVLVRPSLVGDANLDGRVDFFDLSQLLGYKYNTGQPASYTDGDLDYSGTVDFFDISTVLSANYNTGLTFASAASAPSMAAAAPAMITAPAPSPRRAHHRPAGRQLLRSRKHRKSLHNARN
jgi:hypothetical protein